MWTKVDSGYQEWELPDTKSLPNVEVEAKDTSVYVKKAIKKLPQAQQEAIILREYQKLTYEEISKVLACSLEKVKILIFRARQGLKKRLLPLVKEGL